MPSIKDIVVKKSGKKPDAPDASTPSDAPHDLVVATGGDESSGGQAKLKFPHNLPNRLELVLGQNGKAYAVRRDAGNLHVYPVGSRKLDNVLRKIARDDGVTPRQSDIREINEILQSHAETESPHKEVWYRVAPIPGGIEIDLGDEKHTSARITAGKVEIVTEGSECLFYRTAVSKPFFPPADEGNLDLLKKYLNLHPVDIVLLFAWLGYTLAHPKESTNNYVVLVLQGDQGSGKTHLCTNVVLNLTDPNRVGVQILPTNSKDVTVAAQNAHVLCFDNIRGFRQSMADLLCVACTGGSASSRQLYTDDDLHVQHLHVSLVLNGIHSFITQPDLAQRCLPIRMRTLPECDRMSERELVSQLTADMPVILRGLFDLIAGIFVHLPSAEVTNPERMIDFVRWLAAFEKAQGVPQGVYQGAYSHALRQAQLDSLQENPLAAAVLQFTEEEVDGKWLGSPSKLLNELNLLVSTGTQHSRHWPPNAISLSKRLRSLQSSLNTQGIALEFTRGKNRTITISTTESF